MTVGGGTRVIVVAGLSGAGKTTAIAALEDRGYHAIENLPPSTIEGAIAACEQAGIREIAVGLTSSVAPFLDGAAAVFRKLATDGGRDIRLFFFEAADDVLVRRFSETRRPHPIEAEAHRAQAPHLSSALEGIELERQRLASLRSIADIVFDTSQLNVHDLKKRVVATALADASVMATRILSFGFKYGVPTDSDLVFDARFLDNPYFVADLRPFTGLDGPVARFVADADGYAGFVDRLTDLLRFTLPRYQAEGKSYLTVAVGCTGGQHRSVAIAADLHRRIGAFFSGPLFIVHRDIDRKPRSVARADSFSERPPAPADTRRSGDGATIRGGGERKG
jgi:RNase adapter protein RapZ